MNASELSTYGSNLPAMVVPIAADGDKSAIGNGGSNTTDTMASVKFGLPAPMSKPIDESGTPVPRQDVNGLFNLVSRLIHFVMAGGKVPWLNSVATAIGGYATGATVENGGHLFKSLDNNNTSATSDTTKWKSVDPVLTVNSIAPDANGNVDVAGTILQDGMSQEVYIDGNGIGRAPTVVFPAGTTPLLTTGHTFTVGHTGMLLLQVHGATYATNEVLLYLGGSDSGLQIAYVDTDNSTTDTVTFPIKVGTQIFIKKKNSQQSDPSVKLSVIYKA